MKLTTCLAVAALGGSLMLCADEATEENAALATEGGDVLAAVTATSKQQLNDKPFFMLPLCRLIEGGAEVQQPGSSTWEPLEEGRFYPLGCSYRTTAERSRLTIQFGKLSEVRIVGMASFGTRLQQVGGKDRAVILKSGTITVALPRNMPAGLFRVSAPGFSTYDMSGESIFTFAATGDGDSAVVRCVTGSFAVEGRHFKIPSMRAANEIKIRTSQDMLFTGLYGTSGDCTVKLDQGLVSTHDIETGTNKDEVRTLDWRLSPQTWVAIHRAVPKVGERMSVSIMTFDDKGELVNRCTFAEGLSNLNTGEQGEKALAVKAAQTKKAVENADAASAQSATETTSTEEDNKENTEEKAE